jgi:hypothetical protein
LELYQAFFKYKQMKIIYRITLPVLLAVVSVNQAQAFGPCNRHWPKEVRYIAAEPACSGKAAVLLTGSFRKAFSVVFRDAENNDRVPFPGQRITCGLNSCSYFKVQHFFTHRNDQGVIEKVNCFGAPGDSKVILRAKRITVKLKDPVPKQEPEHSKYIKKLCFNKKPSQDWPQATPTPAIAEQ